MTEPASPLAMAAVAWTARAAVAGWLGALLARRRIGRSECDAGPARRFWTFAAAMMLFHSVVAFGLAHHWSLADAWEHTARRTAEVTGLHWGGGLVINVLFVLGWLFDAAMVWRRRCPEWRRGPVGTAIVHGTTLFLMLNATVVFGPRHWIAVITIAAIVWLLPIMPRHRK